MISSLIVTLISRLFCGISPVRIPDPAIDRTGMAFLGNLVGSVRATMPMTRFLDPKRPENWFVPKEGARDKRKLNRFAFVTDPLDALDNWANCQSTA